MTMLDAEHAQLAASEAFQTRLEIHNFLAAHPRLEGRPMPMPPFDWRELERQLASLTPSPHLAQVIPSVVSAIRKQSARKPPELVLRDVLTLAFAILDENFSPVSSDGGEML